VVASLTIKTGVLDLAWTDWCVHIVSVAALFALLWLWLFHLTVVAVAAVVLFFVSVSG